MAATPVTPTEVTIAGVLMPATTVSILTEGHSFTNDGRAFVLLDNTDVAPATMTFTTPGTVGGNLIADLVITVTNATKQLVGPFPPSIYGGSVVMVPSDVDLKFTVFHLPAA